MSRKKIHNHLTCEKPWRPQFALEKMLIRRQFRDYSEADELTVLSSHEKNAYTSVNKKQKTWSISKEPEEKGTVWQLQAKNKTREVQPTAHWEIQLYLSVLLYWGNKCSTVREANMGPVAGNRWEFSVLNLQFPVNLLYLKTNPHWRDSTAQRSTSSPKKWFFSSSKLKTQNHYIPSSYPRDMTMRTKQKHTDCPQPHHPQQSKVGNNYLKFRHFKGRVRFLWVNYEVDQGPSGRVKYMGLGVTVLSCRPSSATTWSQVSFWYLVGKWS